MAILEDHGGECCGVRHIYGMDNASVAEVEGLIRELDEEHGQGNRLIEIILSSRQVGDQVIGNGNNGWSPSVRAEGGWPVVLQRLGFRLVSRFNNSNSRRDCFIFHRVPAFKSTRVADLPFTWTHGDTRPGTMAEGGPGALATPPAPVAPPVTVVATFFRNRFADGRDGALYPNVDAARRSAPRCQRQERVEIRSDGTTHFVTL